MKRPLLIRFRLPSGCTPRAGVDASVQSTTGFFRAALLLGLCAAACSVDGKGLASGSGGSTSASGGGSGIGTGGGPAATGGSDSGGSGGARSGGAPGSGGTPQSGSGGFTAGAGGVIGSGGGMGEPGTGGVPGSGGEPGTGGAASGGAPPTGTGGRGTGGMGSGGRGTGGMGSGGRGTGGAATGGAGTGGAPTLACNATTCPFGCCMGATCISVRTDDRCGTGGAECAPCGACFQCSTAGSCAATPSARWDVICASANLEASESWDPATPDGPLPDPYCRLSVDSMVRGTTGIKNETLTPVWNQSVTATSLTTTILTTSGRWTVSVYDSDGATDDVACAVPGRLTAADLMAGTITYTNKQSCHSLTLKVVCAEN